MKPLTCLMIGLLTALLVGCTAPPAPAAPAGGIVVTDAWARAAATAVELHQTSMEGGMMKMAPVDGIALPAGERVELKPGGLHVMLIGLQRELKAGEKLKLKLYFEQAGAQEIAVEVRKQ